MGALEENQGGSVMLWEEHYDIEYINYADIIKSILEEYFGHD